MLNLKGAFVLNVLPDPVYFVDLHHQTLYNDGAGDVREIGSFADLARARSLSTFTTLGFSWRRYEWPGLRTLVGLGYQRFPDLDDPADRWTAVGNVFRRLGANFDVGLQVQHRWGDDRLTPFAEGSTSVKLALVYSVDHLFNNPFDDRDSILNLEHGYIE